MNKWLYDFEVNDLIKKDGVLKETVTKKFALLHPNRRLREDGELFYAAETSRFAKAGVLPKAAWNTILSNGGGSISEKEREIYGTLLIRFRDASFELQSILIKNDSERNEVEKNRSDELIQELDDIRKEIQSFESSQIAIFENTAEAKARNRAILWWLLSMSYQKINEEYKPIFEGNSFEEKLNAYDFIEEAEKEDGFLLGVIRRFTYLITLWFLGRAETNAELKEMDASFLSQNSSDEEEVEVEVDVDVEEVKVEEAKVEEVKIEEAKVEEVKIEEVKIEEVKVEEVK